MSASQDRIIQLCREKGISARQLEMQLGFSNGYIRTKREREYPTDRLSKIANALGVSVDFLVYGEDDHLAKVNRDFLSHQIELIDQEIKEKNPATQSDGADHSGFSNKDELIRLIGRLTDQEVSDLLAEVKRIILGQ